MNKKQKEIKVEMDEISEKIWELNHTWADPSIKKLVIQLEKKKAACRKKTIPQVKKLQEKKAALQIKFHQAKSQPKFPKIPQDDLPDRVAKWFDQKRSFSDSRDWTILWISEDQNYVIVKKPGCMYWSGIGSQSYDPTVHALYDVRKKMMDQKSIELIGRIKKSDFEELKKKAINSVL